MSQLWSSVGMNLSATDMVILITSAIGRMNISFWTDITTDTTDISISYSYMIDD